MFKKSEFNKKYSPFTGTQKQPFYERFYQFVIEFKINEKSSFIIDDASSNDQILKAISINFNSLENFLNLSMIPSISNIWKENWIRSKILHLSLKQSSLIK